MIIYSKGAIFYSLFSTGSVWHVILNSIHRIGPLTIIERDVAVISVPVPKILSMYFSRLSCLAAGAQARAVCVDFKFDPQAAFREKAQGCGFEPYPPRQPDTTGTSSCEEDDRASRGGTGW